MLIMNTYLPPMPILNRICEQVHKDQKMAFKNDDPSSDFNISWDCRVETLLFYSMRGLKPVGVNRYFMMTCIHERFSKILNKEIPSKAIWEHLESLYDMAALHESEIMPFPNEEVDYELPSSYYDLASDQLGVSLQNNDEESEDSNSKSAKKSSSKAKQNGTPIPNSKTNFATPKTQKQHVNKSETKPVSTSDSNSKQESQLSAKLNKVKRSSSPFSPKNLKIDTSVVKEEPSESPSVKKVKLEASTPLSSKKTTRTENNSSTKKSTKQESSSSTKQSKSDTPDTSLKKVKSEKESSSKKSKTNASSSETSFSKKSGKVESKKLDQESVKKVSDTGSAKLKSDRSSSTSSKSTKQDDSDSSLHSGSRKSSSTAKADSNDKKKKKASPIKRRRT